MKASRFAELTGSEQEHEINRMLSIYLRMQLLVAIMMGICVLIQTISLMAGLGFFK